MITRFCQRYRLTESRDHDRWDGKRRWLTSTGTVMSTASVAGVDVDTRHWIGGRRVASARTFTDISPIDEAPIAEVARGGEAEIEAAVVAASQAFAGWAATPPERRAEILRAIADGVDARIEELAQVETRD